MDLIKQAFSNIKEDIKLLTEQIYYLNEQIEILKQENQEIKTLLSNSLQTTSLINNQTNEHDYSTQNNSNSNIPTVVDSLKQGLEALKPLNSVSYTGNRGVPTDKPTNQQTNQQTNQHMDFTQESIENSPTQSISEPFLTHPQNKVIEPRFTEDSLKINEFEKAKQILDSLDNIKKEIRIKFKRLTSQEMMVFAKLYSLEEQGIEEITYKIIAQQLNLSESSIRDYINKIHKKGIPMLKKRLNNKKITLTISKDLKQVASLATIYQLREI
jgi:hypothetical protein